MAEAQDMTQAIMQAAIGHAMTVEEAKVVAGAEAGTRPRNEE